MKTLTSIIVGAGIAASGFYAGYHYESTYPDPLYMVEGVIEMTDTIICGKEVVLPQYYIPYSAFYNKEEIIDLTEYFDTLVPEKNQKAVIREFFSVMRTEDQKAVLKDMKIMVER
jgi:hypothetical protein